MPLNLSEKREDGGGQGQAACPRHRFIRKPSASALLDLSFST